MANVVAKKEAKKEPLKRAAYSFEEVAVMFGKGRAWTYRQVAKGRFKAITGYGKAMISAAEIERIINTGGGD